MTDSQKKLINMGITAPVINSQELKAAIGKIYARFKIIDTVRYCYRFPENKAMRCVVTSYFNNLGEASTALWETLPDSLKPAGTEIIFKMWDYLKGEIEREEDTA